MNKFQRTALIAIILLLAVIALRPVFSQSPVGTAAARYEYLVVSTSVGDLQANLTGFAKDGWEPVLVASSEGNPPGVTTVTALVLRRPMK
jgi:hypothetical protein